MLLKKHPCTPKTFRKGISHGRLVLLNSTKNDGIWSVTLKDSFQNTVYLERGMPYFAFVDTNAVLVQEN